jgi:hypothetical protein
MKLLNGIRSHPGPEWIPSAGRGKFDAILTTAGQGPVDCSAAAAAEFSAAH